MDYKKGFWIFLTMTMIVAYFNAVLVVTIINENNYYKEYSQITCEGFNVELEFIKKIYPEFAEKKCGDMRIMLDNENKSDIICDQLKEISWPEKIDCENI